MRELYHEHKASFSWYYFCTFVYPKYVDEEAPLFQPCTDFLVQKEETA